MLFAEVHLCRFFSASPALELQRWNRGKESIMRQDNDVFALLGFVHEARYNYDAQRTRQRCIPMLVSNRCLRRDPLSMPQAPCKKKNIVFRSWPNTFESDLKSPELGTLFHAAASDSSRLSQFLSITLFFWVIQPSKACIRVGICSPGS